MCGTFKSIRSNLEISEEEEKETKQARRTKAAKEETVGGLRKAGKKLAATTISEATISKRKKKPEAKKELGKLAEKKGAKKKVAAAAKQLEKGLGALAVAEDEDGRLRRRKRELTTKDLNRGTRHSKFSNAIGLSKCISKCKRDFIHSSPLLVRALSRRKGDAEYLQIYK